MTSLRTTQKPRKPTGARHLVPKAALFGLFGVGLALAIAGAGACGGSDGGNATGTGASTGMNTGGGSTGTNTGGANAGGANAGSSTSTSTGAAGGSAMACPTGCAGKVYECGDCADNDGDGLVDAFDPDCLGPCDNTENSYYPDLPGMTGGPCKADCFWDNGNGSGNDGCYWDHHCDPLEAPPDYPPEGIDCAYDPNNGAGSMTCDEAFMQQPQECLDYCRPLAPNGCDCFGCCELPAGSGKFVWLASEVNSAGSCTIDDVSDPSLCKPCTFVPGCGNPCDICEICIGKPTLPPECYPDGGTDGGTTQQCPPSDQPCGLPGQDPCPAGFYCITGCCVPLPT